MKLQLTESYFTCYQGMKIQEKNYPNFLKSYQQLTSRELENTLCVSINQVREYIPRCVSCLGCRTRYDSSHIDQYQLNRKSNLVSIIL